MKVFVLAFLAVASAAAQGGTWFDLSGEWKYAADRDVPAFAQPAFDDAVWAAVRLPSPVLFTGPKPSWLRHTVAVPAGTDRTDFAVTIGALQDVYQIFVNGVKIGQSGDFDDFSHATLPRSRSYRIPADVASRGAPGPITIAIRGKRAFFLPPQYRLPDEGPYLLASSAQTPWHEGERVLDERWREFSLFWILFGVELGFAAISFLGWWSERARTELLWFSLASAGNAAVMFQLLAMLHPAAVISATGSPFGPLWIAITLSYILFAQFTIRAVDVPRRWPSAALWLGSTAAQFLANPFVTHVWVLALSVGVVVFDLARNWRKISGEDRLLRLVLLLAAADGLQGWVRILLGLPSIPDVYLGDFHVGHNNLLWCLLSVTILILIFRRSGRNRREQERLSAEFEAARTVQQMLFPASGQDGIEAVYQPAQEVGGDFWQSIPLDGGGRLVAVGDVSGKGLKAAMLVSLITGALRNRRSDEPAAILGELNRVAASASGGGFVTAVIARIEKDRIVIANAGHPSPYLDGQELALDAGLPLGVVPNAIYSDCALPLGRARQLTFVSDGVVEAANPRKELFGFDRTQSISTRSAREIADAAKAWGQNDDITVVTFRWAA